MPFPGNRIFPRKIFQSRALGNNLFPVPSQSRHSGKAISRPVSVPKMKQEFPNLKFCISIPEIPEIQYCSGIFLLGMKIVIQNKIKQGRGKNFLFCTEICKKSPKRSLHPHQTESRNLGMLGSCSPLSVTCIGSRLYWCRVRQIDSSW